MTETTYISTSHDWDTDQIMVWERPVAGGPRQLVTYPAPRYFYVPDEEGPYTAIDNTKLKKLVFGTRDEFTEELKRHRRRYESDFQPEARILMDMYYGRPTPLLNYAFLDIEVDYNSKIGWSSPENPYAPINAVTIYQSWTGKYSTYAVPPKGWKGTPESLQLEIDALWKEHKLGFAPDVTICKTERDLLLYLLGDIEEADIISGWNSEYFDNPYIIKRIERVLGKRSMAAMCFKGAPPPREKTVKRFGTDAITFTLSGRTHLDYLDMFKKFTFEGRVSYSLANISAEELNTPKLDYEGTLEQLYNRDFAHFITYNARDVEVLVQLDMKFKLMQLVNQMAHENTVPFSAIMGTVRYVETGIANRAHNVHNRIVLDKNMGSEKNAKVEGAVVMIPHYGLHEWLGSVDITSLYPSVIRALNMSIETFIGQFVEEERAWAAIRKKSVDTLWTLELADGSSMIKSGKDWHEWLREMNCAVSAFGTVFDQNQAGMVADTLTFWFNERKRLQAEKKKYSKLAKEEQDPAKKKEYEQQAEHYDLLQLTKKIQLNSCYGALLNEAFRFGRREIGASVTGTGRQISTHMAQTIGEIITGRKTELRKRYEPSTHTAQGDKLNTKHSAYQSRRGRNAGRKETEPYAMALKEGDIAYLSALPAIPQFSVKKNPDTGLPEVTGTTALYFSVHPDKEERCDEIVYGDTDSCYFLTNTTNYEDAVVAADEIASLTNATFPEFMGEAFNCTGGREKLIAAAREIVAERGLFMRTKKKYTLRVVNLDGQDLRAKPKLKSMGSEIKKADTPKVVQDFLKELMDLVLTGEPYSVLESFINKHRGTLINKGTNVLELAPAKQVNNLDEYYAEYKRTEKIGRGKMKVCPGHVRAAINYNEMIEQYDPAGLKPMRAGDKAAILYLKPNHAGLKSIGFPTDMLHLPPWFVENFQVDLAVTEEKMIDSKIDGIFEALDQETPTLQRSSLNKSFTF